MGQTSDASHLFEYCPSHRNTHVPLVEDVERYRELTAPHVESFNYFLELGLKAGIQDIEPSEICLVDPVKLLPSSNEIVDWSETSSIRFWVEDVHVGYPTKVNTTETKLQLYPRECRERGMVYAGPLTGTFCYQIIERRNEIEHPGTVVRLPKRNFGNLPIMVMSKACHLAGMTPKDLVRLKEEQTEFGGYFIVGGIERCIRLLQVPRRNYPTAIQRSSYKKRGNTYTDLGIAIRCARYNGDESCITNTVHYLTTGGATLRFVARKQEFMIPVILLLRALSGDSTSAGESDAAAGLGRAGCITDEELYRRIIQGDHSNTFLVARAGLLVQDARARFENTNTAEECLAFIGSRFRRLSLKAETTSNVDVGHYMIRRYILVHLRDYKDKLECLLFILRKLYSFAAGDCGADNADSLQNQEILLPGHLMSTFLKEKFEEFLQAMRLGILTEMRRDFTRTSAKLVHDNRHWEKTVDRFSGKSSGGIAKKVQYLLSTGNIVSTTGLDLMQVSGYTIVAERLNFLRYCSHFHSVHRGQFFMEMKTTAVRKLLPDQWGFLCPVHTPDGGPCGLLSHLALKAVVMSYPEKLNQKGMSNLDDLLISLGVSPVGAGGLEGDGRAASSFHHLPVCIDGRIVGGASPSLCRKVAIHLRSLKVADQTIVPRTMEVALVPPGNRSSPYPGLYLFTGAARMVRPVLHRATGKTEMIGPLEQGFMDIACLDEDIREGITTHQELDPTNMLSLVANLTPFSDQNQSPRNMYQCQMGKQTMGTPCHSLTYRPDNKLYRLMTPQAPLVQTSIHGQYKMDEYPNGANAVVGFDMEDAMILNKSSFERGFGHAVIYKTIKVDMTDEYKRAGASSSAEESRIKLGNKIKTQGREAGSRFDRIDQESTGSNQNLLHPTLEWDGLPKVGERLEEGDPLYCILDTINGTDHVSKHKEREIAYVQSVTMLGGDSGNPKENKVSITLRFPRGPVIGDKFSSRHGQKGVLSILWPQEDMPFSESGISPDIIINPHAFPSRMTIGMLVESMAGKSGALHGHFADATPFSFHESGDKVSIDYFGEQLQAAGYNYYGSEALYSGVSGCVMHADLYIGVVFYQRLRHMVSDKYQVRATGPVNELTRQPIKGRKKGGGIRLGEMERDSLLSHGAAFLLHDRLQNCSDMHLAYCCTRCGDLLLATTERSIVQTTGQSASDAMARPKLRLYCRNPSCKEAMDRSDGNDEAVEPVFLPYVYRYLVNELAGMNIKVKLDIK